MQIAMIGLGKMGLNMTRRLLEGGHEVFVYDLDGAAVKSAEAEGARPLEGTESLRISLDAPRAVWVMVPAGEPTEATLSSLVDSLEAGDVIIDGGNSNYGDSVRRAALLEKEGLGFLDVGTSGGIWGLTEGYSMMIGGRAETVDRLQPIFETLAPGPDKGWGHVGPSGAGHFVKMIHNGIEYGLMQAYAEGFAVLKQKSDFGLDLGAIARIWQHGSVVRSWLLDLTAEALEENPEMDGIAPYVSDSGEGRWTVFEAIDLDVPAPVITLSLIQRLRSRDEISFADRVLAAMRQKFGGHAVRGQDGS